MSMSPEQLVRAARHQIHRPAVRNGASAPSAVLDKFVDGVASGRIFAVPFPWQTLQRLTQALIPGTITVICGDPGVGKTYFTLDCLRFWTSKEYDAAVFFVEKDDEFYFRRLLAQEAGNGQLTDFAWLSDHLDEYRAACEQHGPAIDRLGERITTTKSYGQPLTLRNLHEWVKQQLLDGRRVIVIDPITAGDVGAERWNEDVWFMRETQKLLGQHGGSLILITHPVKADVKVKSGHAVAGGAAYFRLCDNLLWVVRHAMRKRYQVSSLFGVGTVDTDTVIQIHKAREGKGTGTQVAMTFGNGLHFSEHGLITGESKEDPEPAADQPDPPMSADQVRRALVLLAKTFGGQVTDGDRRMIEKAFQRNSFRKVESVIEQHRRQFDRISISHLLEELK